MAAEFGRLTDSMSEHMEPRRRPPMDAWFKSRVPWGSLNCDGVWRYHNLKLRVAHDSVEMRYYVAPYDTTTFREQYMTLRIGPYKTLEDATLAAEMLGPIIN